MKFRFILTITVAGFLLFSLNAFAGEPRPSLGVDYGTGILQATPLQLITVLGGTVGAITPKHLRARFNYPLSENIAVRLSAGYGATSEKIENSSNDTSVQPRGEIKTKTSGVPIEGGLIFMAPLGSDGVVTVSGGAVLGYYNYTTTIEGFTESTFGNQTFTTDFSQPDVKTSGLAGSFVLGCSIGLSDNISVFAEASKMVLSLVKIKQDIQTTDPNDPNKKITVGEGKSDYNGLNGLNDLGLVVGISMALGQK